MQLTKIETEKHHQQYLDWVDEMFNKKVNLNSVDGNKVKLILLLIKEYENLHYPIPKN